MKSRIVGIGLAILATLLPARPEDFLDMRFAGQLEKEGLYKAGVAK
jgi:hypothetical protein